MEVLEGKSVAKSIKDTFEERIEKLKKKSKISSYILLGSLSYEFGS